MKEKFVSSFDKSQIYYKIRKGDSKKPALVFIHGLSSNHTVWTYSLNYFKKLGYTVAALDLVGHGKSFKHYDNKRFTVENFAKDVYHVVKKERLRNYVLLGYSLGGMIALMFDKLYPGKASKLVLMGASHSNPLKYQIVPVHYLTPLYNMFTHSVGFVSSLVKRDKYPYVDFGRLANAKNFEMIYNDLKTTPLNCFMWSAKAMFNYDVKDHVHKIKQPMLLISGTKDMNLRSRALKEIKDIAPNATLKIIKGANHQYPLKYNVQVNALIHSFVK